MAIIPCKLGAFDLKAIEKDEALFTELARRGYNFPSLRDNKTQAEPDIIKIG